MQQSKVGFPVSEKSSFPFLWAWIPDVILFESKTISLTFETKTNSLTFKYNEIRYSRP